MASRDRLIATACEVALSRDRYRDRYHYRTDEERVAEMQRRFADGTPADLAAAEFWAFWAGTVIEEAEAAGARELGERLLRRVRDTHAGIRLVR
jgi:hypothetical protein